MKRAYESLIAFGNLLQAPLLLILRLYCGWVLFQTGLGKLEDIHPFATSLASMGFPFAGVQAYMAATAECVGGFCLMVGFASRLMAIPVFITMATAYATAHREAVLSLFSNPQHFIEQAPFLFLLTALLVFAFGPGMISIDYLIQRFIFKKTDR